MRLLIPLLLLAFPLAAEDTGAAVSRLLDTIVERENSLIAALQSRTPIVETYIQETADAPAQDSHPVRDHYFLGQMTIGPTIEYMPLIERTDAAAKSTLAWLPFRAAAKNQPMAFMPRGFAQMAFPDLRDFNRQTYGFEFVRREFLGEIRCLVFDVTPLKNEPGRFVGRVWVEDIGDSIVRFNGTYSSAASSRRSPPIRYFEFDSWRVNIADAQRSKQQWVPYQIYVEEQGSSVNGRPAVPRFKAQTRIWGYAAGRSDRFEELTQILIEPATEVEDNAASKDFSPLESQRVWERQAEENIIARLEKSGFLAPPGAVEDVLNTVINNLIVSADLKLEAHCRVLLTTPLETFSVGHTIVISRGLIDVLPDESSLALVLADELSHIALGHRTPTQFAFRNQTMLADAEVLQRLHFERPPAELEASRKKTIEIMRASPYQKTANAGLFLKVLASRSVMLPRLLTANIGNQLANSDALAGLAELTSSAPELQENELAQIAALPLGSRIKLDPWRDQITLVKTRPLELLSPREKMPFEITPLIPYLTRLP